MRRLLAVCFSGLLLAGCATSPQMPETVQINLPLRLSSPTQHLPLIQLQVQDQRGQSHVLRVEHHQDHAEFATTNVPLATLISEELSKHWRISSQSPLQLTLYIEDALIRVRYINQEYQSSQTIRLRLQGQHRNNTITRRYQTVITGAPLRAADYERWQRSFNQGLTDTIQQLLDDPELQQWLRQQSQ
ncbi:MAG: YajG family lipoprotein [Gammaproteobacteria bacterium]|nr:YajG family lipoprotein [Gammaproteobacteria bacterium]